MSHQRDLGFDYMASCVTTFNFKSYLLFYINFSYECLGVQDLAGASIIMLITKAADAITVSRNKFIDTYHTSLLPPISEFLTFS